MPRAIQMLTRKSGRTVLGRNPTTSFLTATTSRYAFRAGITAAAGTRLALQFILVKRLKILRIPIQRHGCPLLLCLVTTSICQDGVIGAPAAFLGSGSRFSGSLSRIEAKVSVTRQKLTSQKLEKHVAKGDSANFHESSRTQPKLEGLESNK